MCLLRRILKLIFSKKPNRKINFDLGDDAISVGENEPQQTHFPKF
jgi:hypothetical protein